jgi:hypothetical protein
VMAKMQQPARTAPSAHIAILRLYTNERGVGKITRGNGTIVVAGDRD